MNKSFILLLILIFYFNTNAIGKIDSTVFPVYSNLTKSDFLDLKRDDVKRLVLLGQVWTLLKYCHPINNNSETNWDYHLLEIFPCILKPQTIVEAENKLSNWIDNLGQGSSNIQRKNTPKVIFKSLDIEKQISKQIKTKQLRNRLIDIYHLQDIKFNKYVTYDEIPLFNESDNLDQSAYPEVAIRLLALYRFWGAVNYFFPYRYAIDCDWDKVLERMIPHFINARDEDEYKLAISLLTAHINDSHAYFNVMSSTNWKWGENTTSAIVQYIGRKATVTAFRNDNRQDGLEKGDVVKSINGISAKSLNRYYDPYIAASNESVKRRNIGYNMTRTIDTTLNIIVKRKGNKIKLEVPADYKFRINEIPVKELEEPLKIIDSILYIYVYSDAQNIRKALSDTNLYKGIILDMRCYPMTWDDGIMEILGGDSTVYVRFAEIDVENIGSTIKTIEYKTGGKNTQWYDKPIVIMVNENTQSMAEFIVMELQMFPNSVTIGSQTAGADGNTTQIKLPNGSYCKFSSIGVYYPDWSETQRIGVRIDKIVKPTIKSIREGRDKVLDQAINIIKNKKR